MDINTSENSPISVDDLVKITSGEWMDDTKIYRVIKCDGRIAMLHAQTTDGSIVKGFRVVNLRHLSVVEV